VLKLPYTKLNEDQNKEFRDFNGKRFKALGQVELCILSDEFQGFPCRKKAFLVARDCNFKILLGRNTIKDEGLLTRKPRNLSGEGTYPGFQTDPKEGKPWLFLSRTDIVVADLNNSRGASENNTKES